MTLNAPNDAQETTIRDAAHDPANETAIGKAAADVAAAALSMLHCGAVEVFVEGAGTDACIAAASASVTGTLSLGPPLPLESLMQLAPSGMMVGAIQDVSGIDGPVATEAIRIGARSMLVLRCGHEGQLLGFVLCAYETARTFGAFDEREAAGFARIATTALDLAQQANDARDRAGTFATLLDSASAFAEELDLESLYGAMWDRIRRHMDALTMYVALSDAQTGELRTEFAVESGVRVPVSAPAPESGIARDVFASGRPIVLEPTSHAAGNGHRTESVLIVPMKLRDRTVGVISVQSPRPEAYGAAEVDMLSAFAAQAAAAIHNASVFGAERRRSAELAVLHRLAALTNSEARLDRIMAAIVAEAAAAFRADAVSIALENDRGDFTLAATHGVSAGYRHDRVIPGDVLRGLYGDPPVERFIGADNLDSMGQEELVKAEGISSWFLVPLAHQARLIGSLALCGRGRSLRLSPSETRLAQLFADQAAAAMLRAQSAHALTERIEDHDLLSRVGHKLVSRLEVDYSGILSLLHQQLGYTHLAIFTMEGDPPRLVLKAHLGHRPEIEALDFNAGAGIASAVAASGRALHLPEISRSGAGAPLAPDARSELAYPLKFGEQVVGVLDVESLLPDAFTERDRRMLEALADQFAVAISNARQYATANNRLESLGAARAQLEQYAQYLERRQDELKLVNAVSAAASATLNLDRILASAVRSVAEGLKADRCSVGILDEEQQRIEIAAEFRLDGQPTAVGARLPFAGSAMFDRVVTARRTIATDDAQNDPRFEEIRAEMAGLKVRGTVVVPLIAGSHVIGTLTVNSSAAPRRFTPDEIAVLETVANQIALGVRNARLYGRAKDRANEDSLTGLFNHRFLHERLEYELMRAGRANQPLAIALFDLNNFKTFNDTYGHQAGDEVLRVVATTLGMCLRGTDVAGRYGGDEFLVILPQADEPGARMLLNRVKRRLEEQANAGFPPIRIELAAGIAVYPRDGRNKRELIASADRAMYAEKRAAISAAS